MVKRSKKQRKLRIKPQKKEIALKLFEVDVNVPVGDNEFVDHQIFRKVKVVVLAADQNEAMMKVMNRKWWKKTGIRNEGEFR